MSTTKAEVFNPEPIELALCKSLDDYYQLDPDEYYIEPKIDGWRLQIHMDNYDLKVYTRTNHDATGKMPAVEAGLRGIMSHHTVLDGEAVAIRDGKPDFHWTARVLGSKTPTSVQKQRDTKYYISFVAFDMPIMGGFDIRDRYLYERRQLLERVIRECDSPYILCIPQTDPSIDQHLEYTREYGEGSVLKKIDAPYVAGRSKAFLKWKAVEEADVVIMGGQEGKGKFAGLIGAVLFGQYKGGVLTPRGKCSGMTDDQRHAFSMWGDLNHRYMGRVMTITHNGMLANEGFRHPNFHRLRDPQDKRPEDCTWT